MNENKKHDILAGFLRLMFGANVVLLCVAALLALLMLCGWMWTTMIGG